MTTLTAETLETTLALLAWLRWNPGAEAEALETALSMPQGEDGNRRWVADEPLPAFTGGDAPDRWVIEPSYYRSYRIVAPGWAQPFMAEAGEFANAMEAVSQLPGLRKQALRDYFAKRRELLVGLGAVVSLAAEEAG